MTEDPDQDDEVFKKWKEISQKERARIATERHRLFRRNRLNPDEPALLRTKTAMNRWMRQQRQVEQLAQPVAQRETESKLTGPSSGATIPDGIEEGEEDRILPDYYDPLVAIPEHPKRLEWIEDDQGQLVDQTDEYLRQVPSGYFLSPRSSLTMKMEANMRQMQETRKMTAKIGVVKQMQLQSQVIHASRLIYQLLTCLTDVPEPVPEVRTCAFCGSRCRAAGQIQPRSGHVLGDQPCNATAVGR